MRLIKKLPNDSQKRIIEKLQAARKKQGGSPGQYGNTEDLPF